MCHEMQDLWPKCRLNTDWINWKHTFNWKVEKLKIKSSPLEVTWERLNTSNWSNRTDASERWEILEAFSEARIDSCVFECCHWCSTSRWFRKWFKYWHDLWIHIYCNRSTLQLTVVNLLVWVTQLHFVINYNNGIDRTNTILVLSIIIL